MDPALLTSPAFWKDPRPYGAMDLPPIPALEGHVIFATSGSTGRPKGVALSKKALLSSAAAVNQHLCVGADSRWGLALPTHHVGGFGVAARAFESQVPLIDLRGKWNPDTFARKLSTEGVTHTSLVPTQVHDLVKAGLRAPSQLSAIVVGGGRLDVPTGQMARSLGWPVLASYGMTETGSQVATQRLGQLQKPYQLAPLPLLPLWSARLSTEGLLEITGEALFTGYLCEGRFTPRENSWHTTSDHAELTEDGITPRGRADLQVKVLGELVDLEAIERKLLDLSVGKFPEGSLAITAIPDERMEHLLVPVFEAEVPTEIMLEILSVYAQTVPGYLRLSPPVIVKKLPRSSLGKLLRTEIAALCQQKNRS